MNTLYVMGLITLKKNGNTDRKIMVTGDMRACSSVLCPELSNQLTVGITLKLTKH